MRGLHFKQQNCGLIYLLHFNNKRSSSREDERTRDAPVANNLSLRIVSSA